MLFAACSNLKEARFSVLDYGSIADALDNVTELVRAAFTKEHLYELDMQCYAFYNQCKEGLKEVFMKRVTFALQKMRLKGCGVKVCGSTFFE